MKLAIVGTSILTSEKQKKEIYSIIEEICITRKPKIIISGGAKGVDNLAYLVGHNRGIEVIQRRPMRFNWTGYRERNKVVANDCDELVCITTNCRKRPCYHCGTDTHDKTAGCWTMHYAKSLGKKVELIVI